MARPFKMDRLSNDGTLGGNSQSEGCTEHAIKTYVDTLVSSVTASSVFGTLSATLATLTTANTGNFTANTASSTVSTVKTSNITTANIATANITNSSIITATITDLRTVNIADVASATATGITGQIVFGTSSIYWCIGTDTWIKVNTDSW